MSEQRSTTELVSRATAADQGAWNELVRRYSGMVWTVAREHGLSQADAADVAQTVWLRLAQNLTRLRHPERLAGWLATTARREALRVVAIRRREAPLAWVDIHTLSDGPETAAVLADRDDALWRAYSALSERCRTLLRLIAYAPELTYAQAASALGIRVSSVGPTRGRCLAALRRRLETAGVREGAVR